MSKAEKRALEAYPIESHEMYDDLYRQRNAYVKGYQQAEKDLELTWEDARKIFALCADILYNERNIHYPINPEDQEEFYQEVLKRFKEERSKR